MRIILAYFILLPVSYSISLSVAAVSSWYVGYVCPLYAVEFRIECAFRGKEASHFPFIQFFFLMSSLRSV